jgi:hypothetical protein
MPAAYVLVVGCMLQLLAPVAWLARMRVHALQT